MCFVDVMRLASVAASPAAQDANADRYPEFVDVADQHLAELRAQATRLGPNTDLSVAEKLTEVERGIAWAVARLRRSPRLDRPWLEFAVVLAQIAERVDALAKAAGPDYYSSRLSEVASPLNVAEATPFTQADPDTFVRARFAAQDGVLAEAAHAGKFSPATIRDDMNQRLAVPYFAIDLALLRRATEVGT
jgi:hypothetical protein